MKRKIKEFEEWVEANNYATTNDKDNFAYSMLALCGETGEMADTFKKFLRGDYSENRARSDKDFRMDMAYEAGDVLHYLARLVRLLGFTLEEIAALNIRKIEARKASGVIPS